MIANQSPSSGTPRTGTLAPFALCPNAAFKQQGTPRQSTGTLAKPASLSNAAFRSPKDTRHGTPRTIALLRRPSCLRSLS